MPRHCRELKAYNSCYADPPYSSSVCLSVSVSLSDFLPFVHLPVCLSVCLPLSFCICPFCLSACLFACRSISLSSNASVSSPKAQSLFAEVIDSCKIDGFSTSQHLGSIWRSEKYLKLKSRLKLCLQSIIDGPAKIPCREYPTGRAFCLESCTASTILVRSQSKTVANMTLGLSSTSHLIFLKVVIYFFAENPN